jgi:hypothetical protein
MGNSLLVAGPESSHQSKPCFGCSTDDKECKVFECSHGEAQPLEVVLSHTRIVRWCRALTKKVTLRKVAICSLEDIAPCITPRRGKLLVGDFGRKLHHI